MDRTNKDFQVSCNNCKLDSICLPRGLSLTEINELSIEVKTNGMLNKGDYIYRQGDPFSRIVALKSGSAKLVNIDNHGNEHILNVSLPGELMGFDGLYQDHYNCSAIALEKISFCILPADNLEFISKKIPSVSRELFKHCSDTINQAQQQIISTKSPAEEKLSLFLMDLSDRLHARGFSSHEFYLPLTRQEIGEHLGLTLETVSRMLKQFQNQNLISVERKLITILDADGLRSIHNEK